MLFCISELPINKQASRRNLLRCKQEPSEFEIQAHLYWKLKEAGYCVRGEVSVHRGKARFDIAIFQELGDRFPIRIVEIKKRRRSINPNTYSGGQVHKYYSDYGIPVDLVCGMRGADEYLTRIVALYPP